MGGGGRFHVFPFLGLSPSLVHVVIDADLVQYPAYDVIHEVVDGLRLVIRNPGKRP